MAKRKTQRSLHIQGRLHTVQDVRKIIVDRMAERNVSAYALAKMTGISHQTIYKFVDGTYEMSSDKLALVLTALELEVRPKE